MFYLNNFRLYVYKLFEQIKVNKDYKLLLLFYNNCLMINKSNVFNVYLPRNNLPLCCFVPV